MTDPEIRHEHTFPDTPEIVVSLNQFACAFEQQAGVRLVQLTARPEKGDVMMRLSVLPRTPSERFVRTPKDEIPIRGMYAISRSVFLTGGADLRQLLKTPQILSEIADAMRNLNDLDTRAPIYQIRMMGEPECCLMRRGGSWEDLSPPGSIGYIVFGLDVSEERVYALKRSACDELFEISTALVPHEGPLDWRPAALLPHKKRLVDASRLVRNLDGHLMSLVQLGDEEESLLTLERGRAPMWSHPEKVTGVALEADDSGQFRRAKNGLRMTSLLLQRRCLTDGWYAIRRPLEDLRLTEWPYLMASSL